VDLGLYRDASVPQLQIVLDRGSLARAGINVNAAQDVVQTALGGSIATTYWENERPVPVRLIFPVAEREDEARIGNILVPSASGGHVPLREVAQIEKAIGKAAITREANSRVLALKFNVEGRDLGSVVTDAQGSPRPFQGEEIGAPPRERAKPGRANREGDVVLYVADQQSTAVAEQRPWRGLHVSVADGA
jgi:cobalt-zinc-cadmium resistance protein CzcA